MRKKGQKLAVFMKKGKKKMRFQGQKKEKKKRKGRGGLSSPVGWGCLVCVGFHVSQFLSSLFSFWKINVNFYLPFLVGNPCLYLLHCYILSMNFLKFMVSLNLCLYPLLCYILSMDFLQVVSMFWFLFHSKYIQYDFNVYGYFRKHMWRLSVVMVVSLC